MARRTAENEEGKLTTEDLKQRLIEIAVNMCDSAVRSREPHKDIELALNIYTKVM